MKEIFIVVGKQPLKNFSKSRLAASVGQDIGYEIYKTLCHDFFDHFYKSSTLDLLCYITPYHKGSIEFFKECGVNEKNIRSQIEGGFFKRLSQIFKENSDAFIHLTGTDIPAFPYQFLKDVDRSKINIGPDRDGGFYYFSGLGKNFDLLDLETQTSSKDSIFERLVQRCKNHNKKINIIEPWSDIDTKEDLLYTIENLDKNANLKTHNLVKKLQIK